MSQTRVTDAGCNCEAAGLQRYSGAFRKPVELKHVQSMTLLMEQVVSGFSQSLKIVIGTNSAVKAAHQGL